MARGRAGDLRLFRALGATFIKIGQLLSILETELSSTLQDRRLKLTLNRIPVLNEMTFGDPERLLHNFALNLLVPEQLYQQVSHYVDRTHLRGRLVYLRVREDMRAPTRSLSPDSVVR